MRRMKRIFAILSPVVAVVIAAVAAFTILADEVPNTYIVDRTVEVSPGARKNKAFPMAEGSALCDLHLMAKAPWRIRSSHIALRDDKTLWFKVSDREYIIASGYAPNEYVVVRGELEKPGGGSGKGAEERPQFQVTVPKVDLQWAAKHGEASQEEKEDSVPAVIMMSEDPNDFGTLIVCAPKDDFHLSDPRVTLTWAPANAVKVYKGAAEVGSGVSWLLMAGTQLELSVKVVRPEADVKFTLKGEPDVVSHERAVDYVRACCGECSFIAYVDQPGDGGDDDVREGHDVGHAFWELRTNIPEIMFEEGLRRYLNVPMGFYPRNPSPRWGDKMGHLELPDESHIPDVVGTWNVDYQNFLSVIRFSNQFELSVIRGTVLYNLETRNCASATIEAAASCGIVLPRTIRQFFIFSDRRGVCPGQLGEDIRAIMESRR